MKTLLFAALAFSAQMTMATTPSDPIPFALSQVEAWWENAYVRTVSASTQSEDFFRATVTITDEGLFGDSVEAERNIFELEAANDGSWSIKHRTVLYRCELGRGQQDFKPDLCL